eukprot:CAMPEP_0185844216 /NCGR_PEP_ID=MMETSP1354-20130828/457_1 /TAXON_ID=708628 /ORGANISM="Erythrolobus madagascarensis, Strain CCMP3276" /LENGTH=211 /DNA_ID=CAMNT_0028543841 /DNA_START=76 /DNA_END=711 /DNA_ORIENTATION=-
MENAAQTRSMNFNGDSEFDPHHRQPYKKRMTRLRAKLRDSTEVSSCDFETGSAMCDRESSLATTCVLSETERYNTHSISDAAPQYKALREQIDAMLALGSQDSAIADDSMSEPCFLRQTEHVGTDEEITEMWIFGGPERKQSLADKNTGVVLFSNLGLAVTPKGKSIHKIPRSECQRSAGSPVAVAAKEKDAQQEKPSSWFRMRTTKPRKA